MERPTSSRVLLVLAALLLAPWALRAQKLKAGDDAPPITLTRWLNWGGSKPPSLAALEGRVIMLEFWGTWCAPCVRAMPHVQEVFQRYTRRGLTVLAISYEQPKQMTGFLKQHAYTMPVGSDPEKTVVKAYGVSSWPTTVIIDQTGKVAWVGDPDEAESRIEKALGLEASPGALLASYMESLKAKSKQRLREALERLVEKAPSEFDLKAWARSQGGAEKPAASGGARGAPALKRCSKAWASGDSTKKTSILCAMAQRAPESFDLAAWARTTFGKRFPVSPREMKDLLARGAYDAVLDAILIRRPSMGILKQVTRKDGLRAWCVKRSPQAKLLAKKAIMARNWIFADRQPKDNKSFWNELAISGVAFSADRKHVLGITLGGKMVMATAVGRYIDNQLSRHLLMDTLASGHAPRLKRLKKKVARERTALRRDLEARYGATRN